MRYMKRARKAFSNISGEDIPPRAFVATVDGGDTNKKHILDGDIPDGGADTVYLVNGPKTIADGDVGHGYWTYEICVVAYDPGGATPVAGEEWGPVASSWYLDETGEGFIVLSVDSGKGVCRVAPKRSAGTGTTTGAANCPCGTQYKRGSQTLTLNSVDYEHATTYTVTATCFTGTWWFPEVTYDTGTWLSGVEEILACYAGGIDAELQIEPFYVTIDGVDVLHAWAILTTDANDCTDIDSVAGEDVEARWICRNWNPLGPTAQFELMGPSKLGDVDLPKFLCVSPNQTITCDDWTLPERFRVTGDIDVSGTPYTVDASIAFSTSTTDECAYSEVGSCSATPCISSSSLRKDTLAWLPVYRKTFQVGLNYYSPYTGLGGFESSTLAYPYDGNPIVCPANASTILAGVTGTLIVTPEV